MSFYYISIFREPDFDVILNHLHTLFSPDSCAVQRHIVVNRVGPVLAAGIIIVVFRPVGVRTVNKLMGPALGDVHPIHDGFDTVGPGGLNVEADHIFIILQDVIRTLADDDAALCLRQTPDQLRHDVKEIDIGDKSLLMWLEDCRPRHLPEKVRDVSAPEPLV